MNAADPATSVGVEEMPGANVKDAEGVLVTSWRWTDISICWSGTVLTSWR